MAESLRTLARQTPGRYLIPNLITLSSLVFAIVSAHNSIQGNFEFAAWLVLWCTLLDKLDGTMARLLNATSEFGVELDSFADYMAFAVAPTTLVFGVLTKVEGAALAGADLQSLQLFSVLFLLAGAVRLARFNVMPGSARFMFGLPTTAAGGLIASLTLVLLRWNGTLVGDVVAGVFPYLLFVFAILEVSTLRLPKLGGLDEPMIAVYVKANAIVVPLLIVMRKLPEVVFLSAAVFVVGGFVWCARNRRAVDAVLAAEGLIVLDGPAEAPASPEHERGGGI